MTHLLESAATLIGITLVLALAAERLQELVKAAFALKSNVRVAGVRRLIMEAASAAGFGEEQAGVVVERVFGRLRALNQRGLRTGALRLDHLTKDALKKLVTDIDPETVDALRAIKADVAQDRLRQLAANLDAWYDLALQPVDGRYSRRMRLGALASAAVVVLALNADGLALMRQAWSDTAFRDSVTARLGPVLQSDSSFRASLVRRDSLRADSTADSAARATADSALTAAFARRTVQVDSALAQAGLQPFQYPRNFKVTPQWVLGILLSILLVSLGAPFWHDVLEGVLGLKRKAVAAAAGEAKGDGT